MRDIKDFTLKELKREFAALNEPPYRAVQVFGWLYKRCAVRFRDMKNLPEGLIERLEKDYYVASPGLEKRLKSKEGAEKFLFRLNDNNYIEAVLIYSAERKTICLSTQVGCKFSCPFCASGKNGFKRDLTPAEIIGQILALKCDFSHHLTNYVFMGMGEPLDNYENLKRSIKIMHSKEGLDVGSRRITISTCGLVPGINKLKDLGLEVNLSISLHATNDSLRNILVPINRRYQLEKLFEACEKYINKVGRLITLEYVLINDVNDSTKDANRLADIAKRLHAKVNLIKCSSINDSEHKASCAKNIDLFVSALRKKKVKFTLRKSKGSDIQAACGQLAGEIV